MKEQQLTQAKAWGLTNRRGRRVTSEAIGTLLPSRVYSGIADVSFTFDPKATTLPKNLDGTHGDPDFHQLKPIDDLATRRDHVFEFGRRVPEWNRWYGRVPELRQICERVTNTLSAHASPVLTLYGGLREG